MNELVKWDEIEHQIDEAKDLKTIIQMQEQVEAIKTLVKQIDGGREAQNKCSRYRIFLEQKVGEHYKKLADKRGDKPNKDSSTNFTNLTDKGKFIEETGKTRTTINKWVKEADIQKEKILEYEALCNKEEKELTSSGLLHYSLVHFSSKSSEWATPEIIINKTIELFGEIDLDPCSNPDFPNVPAKEYFIEKDDGLSKEWHGKVYMNPPYGSEIKKWTNYFCEQFEKGNIQEGIILVPSRTDTEWFFRMEKYPRCFIRGRLKFGDSGNSAPFPSMAVYLGENIKGFIRIFSDIGGMYGLIK